MRHSLPLGQYAPSVHETQPPSLQTRLSPHDVPFGWFAVSWQTGVPVEQSMLAARQGLAPVHEAPAEHATQPPLLQTRFAPHDVPFGWFADSRQTALPVVQETVPVRQGVATEHVAPAEQGWQPPS